MKIHNHNMNKNFNHCDKNNSICEVRSSRNNFESQLLQLNQLKINLIEKLRGFIVI